MARRARRSPRVVWLPQDPFFSVDAATTAGSTLMLAGDFVAGGNAGNSATTVAPVVRDVSPNPLTAANTLADINESGYRLRRIVGKFWCFTDQIPQDSPPAVVVTAGFIILRTDPAAGTPQNPVTAAYATNDILNTESPWIWRRSYFLRNRLTTNAAVTNNVIGQDPAFSAGGVSDGPHIDQKTARIVGPDERLFLVITATTVFPSDPQGPGAPMSYVWDVRVLASMRSNIGNRRNASR